MDTEVGGLALCIERSLMSGSSAKSTRYGLLLLGNQLFPEKHIRETHAHFIFMAEHSQLASYYRFHKHKIILFLSAMRHYASELKQKNYIVNYIELQPPELEVAFTISLKKWIQENSIEELLIYEIEDKFFETEIFTFLKNENLKYRVLQSPLFLTSRESFKKYLASTQKPFMKTFYEQQRKSLKVLLDDKNKPVGGKWSFDSENRKKLPPHVHIPKISPIAPDPVTQTVMTLVQNRFSDHPGDAKNFWLPTTRKQSIDWFKHFVAERLSHFGDYQDAITDKDPFLFHSVISPMLNMGLITPKEVLLYVLQQHKKQSLPLASLEGFVRQVMGWREFVRGIYQNYSEQQDTGNFWGHQRRLKKCWYDGTTGIPPLDQALLKTVRYGYAHHIERLMIFANFMTLCQIHPNEAHKWFMEMFVDSSDWVMGPNVYGMGLWSDGGIFATKPYICGSNYYLKMSDYKKGDWCSTVDALYWSFIDTHKEKLAGNHRFGIMLSQLKKISPETMDQHRSRSKEFIASVSESD